MEDKVSSHVSNQNGAEAIFEKLMAKKILRTHEKHRFTDQIPKKS